MSEVKKGFSPNDFARVAFVPVLFCAIVLGMYYGFTETDSEEHACTSESCLKSAQRYLNTAVSYPKIISPLEIVDSLSALGFYFVLENDSLVVFRANGPKRLAHAGACEKLIGLQESIDKAVMLNAFRGKI